MRRLSYPQNDGKNLICRDEGVTFVEVAVTLLMLVAAAVVLMHSLYFGNRMLDVEMHKQQVLYRLQEEMEYWIGRLYLGGSDFPTDQERAASNGYDKFSIIDYEGGKTAEPIIVLLSKSAIVEYQDQVNVNPDTGDPLTAYWKFTVYAEWKEPNGQEFSRQKGTDLSLTTYIAPRF
jgi:hypothetical protein